jgi:hypothetical protein
MAKPSPRAPLSGRIAEHRSSLARYNVLAPLQSFTIGRPAEAASLRGCASFAKRLGQFYPLRGAVRDTVHARAYNLRPITPYLDENLTSPSSHLPT